MIGHAKELGNTALALLTAGSTTPSYIDNRTIQPYTMTDIKTRASTHLGGHLVPEPLEKERIVAQRNEVTNTKIIFSVNYRRCRTSAI